MSDIPDVQAAANDANEPAKRVPAEAPSGIHMSRPLDEMSLASVTVVADAAALIAATKLANAEAKMAAAKAAMERLAAMKAGKTAPPQPEEVVARVAVAAQIVQAAEPVRVAVPPAPVQEAPAPGIVKPIMPAERPVHQHASGIVRLAGALRLKAAEQAPALPKITGKRSLDPIANHTGLGRPATVQKRKIVTPGLIFLLALMTFYALYASGNLPQFDRWTDSVVNDAHAHNDQVVGGILHAGQYILIGGGLLIVLIAVLLIKNYLHQKHNAEHERDFHTR